MEVDRLNAQSKVGNRGGGLCLLVPRRIFWVAWAWEVGERDWIVVMVVGEREAILQITSNRPLFIPMTGTRKIARERYWGKVRETHERPNPKPGF